MTTREATECSRGAAAAAGALAAAAALAVGELVAAVVGNGTSMVSAVGTEVIDRFAAQLKDTAVSLFGTNDKAALVTGIVLVSLLLGGGLGVLARRRFAVAVVGFAAFGAVGWWAYASDPQGSVLDGFVISLVSVVAGVATLALLLRLAPTRVAPAVAAGVAVGADVVAAPRARVAGPVARVDPRRPSSRRTFLTTAAVVGAGTVVVAAAGRRLRSTDVAAVARRSTLIPRPAQRATLPAAQPFTVDGVTPYITPNVDFYRIDTALSVPQVDVAAWQLDVKGMVDRPFSLTYAELLAMDAVEEVVTLQCVSNAVGGDLVGNAVWQGVRLARLLDQAGLQTGAEQVVGRSVDRFTVGFPSAVLTDGRPALVAYAMNGEPLPVRHGFPARLIVAGLYGYVSATKWLRSIELTTWDGFDGYWVPRGWSKEGPIKTASRIDVPTGTVTAGPVAVGGVAWAPTRGIDAVELQVDDGPWTPCELGRVASANTWVQWRYTWTATPGRHVLRVRAVDGTGEVQSGDVSPPDPNGATGWHARRIQVQAP